MDKNEMSKCPWCGFLVEISCDVPITHCEQQVLAMGRENMLTAFRKALAHHSKPELAQQEGHVWQVWEDGEVTLQKSGPLLWQRLLHTIKPPLGVSVNPELFPEHLCQPGSLDRHGFIFTDEDGALKIRDAIKLAGV